VTSDKPVNAMLGTFSCAQPGCTNIFQKYLNLESHIVFGKQKIFLSIKSALCDIKNKWKYSFLFMNS
jgi:hypothetical protein